MSKEIYITGLDIGTSHIRAVQGKVNEGTGKVNIIGAAEVPSQGLRKGVVVDIEDTVSSISTALERVERMTGVPVPSANISVSGSHITSVNSHGVIAVSRADGEITEADIVRVIDASQAISIPNNREVLHVFPKNFTLDGQSGIKDPAGMSGIRLEVESIIVQAGSPYVKNLSRCVVQAGIETDELVLGALAAGESVLSKRQKDLGVCVLDLGAGTSGLAVYEEGELLHTCVIPIGGQHITNDIAIGLRCSIETAEKVKLMYGHADPKAIDKTEEIALSQVDENEGQVTYRGMMVEIIEARLEEIFDRVNGELKKINRDGKLPAGLVLTGGGSALPGVVEFSKKHLRLPATLGMASNVETVIDRVQEPGFATAVGLVMWGMKYSAPKASNFGGMLKSLSGNETLSSMKRWLKSLLP